MERESVRVLLIEDSPADAFMIEEMLSEAGGDFILERVSRLSEGIERISRGGLDIIISDLGLPDSQGMETVRTLIPRAMGVPLIVLTGLCDDQVGIPAVQEGAQDYLVKGQVNGAVLARSIRYAIERKLMENERERLIRELTDALATVKRLSGLLPICASCKKIRNDKGYWEQIDAYIREHSEAEFSHSLCPDCAHRLYPEYFPDSQSSEGGCP